MTEMTTESAPTEGQVTEEAAVEVASRPDYLPEKFWNAEEGAPNIEGMAKSYSELEKKFSQRASSLKEELQAELMSERKEGVPESPEGYEFTAPEIPNMPEGWDVQMQSDDPMLNWWRETAHQQGMSQEQFQDGINKYFDLHFGSLPDREGELKALGDNAQDRIDRVDMWLNKNLDENEYNAIADFAVTADAIQVLEKIIGIEQSEPSLSSFEGEPMTGNVNEDKLRQMMDDPRYWKQGEIDDAYRAEVTKAWQKHYG